MARVTVTNCVVTKNINVPSFNVELNHRELALLACLLGNTTGVNQLYERLHKIHNENTYDNKPTSADFYNYLISKPIIIDCEIAVDDKSCFDDIAK